MKAKEQNVPVLRFPGFSGEWERSKIKELASLARGKFTPRPRNDPSYYGGEIPFVQTGDVVNAKGIISSYSKTLNEKGLKVSKLFPKGTILITIAANIGYTGILKIDMACPDSLIGIQCKKKINNYFLNIFLSTKQRYLDYLAPKGAQKNINVDFLAPYQIPYPSLPEQQKIAAFLIAVDTKIEQLSKKKALLEQYKKGIMQKLFSQELRFKDEQGNDFPDWEEKRLGDILFEHKIQNTADDISEVFSVAKYKGVINQFEHLGRSYAADSINHYKVVNPFDIIYTKSPTSEFPFGIIKQNLIERTGVVSPLYAVFRPLNKDIGYMLHCYFSSWVNTYNYLNPLVQKGAKNTMSIRNDDFLNGAKISFSIIEEEQRKIATFLSSIDQKINLVSTELEKAQTFKKGLLQQMFV